MFHAGNLVPHPSSMEAVGLVAGYTTSRRWKRGQETAGACQEVKVERSVTNKDGIK